MTQYRTRATLIGARILLSVLSSWIQSPPAASAAPASAAVQAVTPDATLIVDPTD